MQKHHLGHLQDGVFVMVSEHYLHSKSAVEKEDVRLYTLWWRRGESNPRPKTDPRSFLRVQSILSNSSSRPLVDKLTGQVVSDIFKSRNNSFEKGPLIDAQFRAVVLPD